jgi:membrane-bound lytic murein transglycosylase D
VPASATEDHAESETVSPWDKLRARFVLHDCDDNSEVQRWARWYTHNPTGFAQSLRGALPFLLVVADRLEYFDVPGEFAFLPYIESNYQSLVTRGNRAAGIWQLMPATARAVGLSVGRDYDGRLDVPAATDAALKLLGHYHDKFADWRLADMAFNAGEFAVQRHFDSGHDRYSAEELRRLPLPRGTHQHLAKLLAVSCVVADPDRYEVRLPEPDADDRLVATDLSAPLDLELAARLAHIDAQRLRQLNPGYRDVRMPDAVPYHLLLPAASTRRLTTALAQLPPALWRDWHRVTLRQSTSVDELASTQGLDARTLALANAVDAATTLAAGTSVLLPGRAASATVAAAGFHRVEAGDSLWRIARQQHLSIADLRRWNRLETDSLRIGQRLRLTAPDADDAAPAVAASAH